MSTPLARLPFSQMVFLAPEFRGGGRGFQPGFLWMGFCGAQKTMAPDRQEPGPPPAPADTPPERVIKWRVRRAKPSGLSVLHTFVRLRIAQRASLSRTAVDRQVRVRASAPEWVVEVACAASASNCRHSYRWRPRPVVDGAVARRARLGPVIRHMTCGVHIGTPVTRGARWNSY